MNTSRNRLCRLTGTAAAVVLIVAGAAHPVVAKAADGPIPCSAFQRNAYGGWRVLSPVIMDFGGTLYSPTVGTTFAAGSSAHGIEMSDVLDQQCGNR
jgi:hypothetical protein